MEPKTRTSTAPPAWPGSRQIRIVQWLLPLMLTSIVVGYELMEHFFLRREGLLARDLLGEILFFGLLGPAAVWWVLGYIGESHRRLEEAYQEIQALNQDLERRVEERTAELARKNAELARANAELKALDRLKSEFVTLVSHELRAPLTNINGAIELLSREREVLPPARQETLDLLRKETDRLMRLVQNILDVSALEAGRLQIHPRPVLLRPFLHQLLEPRVRGWRRHALRLEVPADLPPVWADEDHLAEVVLNLVDNAVKYSPEGGEIRIEAYRRGAQEIVLAVQDQGIGIPPEDQPYLFDRFYRGREAGRHEASGHGLGLYFCRKLVEAQGGRIWVESEGVPGRGSTFFVALPLCPEVEDDGQDPVD